MNDSISLRGILIRKNKYTEDDTINLLEFKVDNIFVVFGGKVLQQRVGISIGAIIHFT